jgi:hypothetical protein
MSTTNPICPILTIRNESFNEICLGADCALYLPAAKKCSIVYIGFHAMMEVQKMQQMSAAQPQQARQQPGQ